MTFHWPLDRNCLYRKRAVDTKGVPTYFSGFFSEIVVVPEEVNNDIANANDVCSGFGRDSIQWATKVPQCFSLFYVSSLFSIHTHLRDLKQKV